MLDPPDETSRFGIIKFLALCVEDSISGRFLCPLPLSRSSNIFSFLMCLSRQPFSPFYSLTSLLGCV